MQLYTTQPQQGAEEKEASTAQEICASGRGWEGQGERVECTECRGGQDGSASLQIVASGCMADG